MWSIALSLFLVAYLPGFVIFRVPFGQRDIRSGLSAEERVYWHVILSLLVTSVSGLVLAASGWYRFEWLLLSNGLAAGAIGCAFRGRLRLGSIAPKPHWSTVTPLAIIAVAVSVSFRTPPAEYIIGGRDPGTYVNEGIQIAQRGSLGIDDQLVASIPEHLIPLFATEDERSESSYGSRFMGFYLVDAAEGRVMGQFPHLYPVWIAVGYGINGLTGTRYVVTFLATLGVLSVFFAGAWLVGRPAATAGALLLAVNVAQVWYSRYPNAEILLQALVFASILAYSRATVGGDRFFALVAGLLVTLAGFTHRTGIFVIGIFLVAGLLGPFARQRPPFVFPVVAIGGSALVGLYYLTVLTPYLERYVDVIRRFPNLPIWALVGAVVLGALLAFSRTAAAAFLARWLPMGIVVIVVVLAGYAYFLRVPVGRLAPHDAASLRTFTEFYLSPLGLGMALIGLVLVARQRFWAATTFVLTVVGFSVLFFYKIRIIPEHFWAARRFLAVVLPGACLLIGATAFPQTLLGLPQGWKGRLPRVAIAGLGTLLVVVVGSGYLRASTSIGSHTEHEGVIPRLEQLNTLIAEGDLVLVESRQASDLHTLAVPLAYVYARHVLVLRGADPDKVALQEFLTWARGRYRRVLYVGGGSTLLLSRSTDAVQASTEEFSVPEYESAYDAYPREVRLKRYNVTFYELIPRVTPVDSFDLDVGSRDELLLRRFHGREELGSTETTFRWSRDVSFISVLGISRNRRVLTVWMSNGGRPSSAGPATVEISLNGLELGTVTVGGEFEPYRFEVPQGLAAELENSEAPGRLRLGSSTWKPGDVLAVDDPRDLGVMVDRVTVDRAAVP
jgi:hypothetical protein